MADFRSTDSFGPLSPLATAARELVLDGFRGYEAAPAAPVEAAWNSIRAAGTELWLDTGDLDAAASLWCDAFTALTTNNTLLNKEVQKGIYDDLVPQIAETVRRVQPGIADQDLILEIAFCLNARHGLRLVERFGAKVSVELHTDLADDVEASVAYGRRYHEICPTHFIVKVPLTPSGLIAARQLSDANIPVNFTLGFSARQNLLIAKTARPAFCNVFMGRVNAFLIDSALGDGKNAGERATAASQRVVAELRQSGTAPTRQIGASMRSGDQVPGLAGLDVYTMPTAVTESFLENGGEVADGVRSEFPVEFAPAVDAKLDQLDVFWDVDDKSRQAIDELAGRDVAKLSAEALCEALNAAGCPNFFPDLNEDEEEAISNDGKIPSYARWKDDVRAGRVAWDTLLTLAGLASFAGDQAALDDRIRAQL